LLAETETRLDSGSPRAPLRDAARRLLGWTLSRSLLTRSIAGSVLLAVLVAGTFSALLLAMSGLRSSANLQAHSRDVTTATLGLEQVVDELELSLRAFVVSGNARFLDSWRQAQSELTPALASVTQLLGSQPAEAVRAAQISTLIGAYVSEYGVPLIRIFRVSPRAAEAPVATSEGLFRLNTIRVRLDGLLAGEAALASTQAAAAKRQAGQAVWGGVAALSAAAGLLLAYGLFVARGIAGPVRSVAAGASRVAAGDLSIRLSEEGPAEMHALTSAFNAMTRSLEHGKRELEAQNEELRQGERLKSQLVSIVSHELRTPLTSILGYTTLLRKRDFDRAETDRFLDIIHLQASRLESLVDRFLDGEHVEAGRIELDDELLDLKPLLLTEAQLVSDKVSKHRVEVAIGAERLPVRGDRDRLAQVIGNLLTNAVKYSPDGGLVEVVGEVAGDVLRLEVRDEGIGVPEVHRSRIFTKFFRGDALQSGIPGTGLGLAVSREIVEAHGGRIGFSSRPSGGSSFWVELPLAAEADPGAGFEEAIRELVDRERDVAPQGAAP
jgi:signal transduction histidine kinase